MELSSLDSLWDGKLLAVEHNGKLSFIGVCRLCGNGNIDLLSIFGGEGLENDLQSKIDAHLPIQILESDSLPHTICSQCASTLVTWHHLTVNCLKVDEKLREIMRCVETKGVVDQSADTTSILGNEVNSEVSVGEGKESSKCDEIVTEITPVSADDRFMEITDSELSHNGTDKWKNGTDLQDEHSYCSGQNNLENFHGADTDMFCNLCYCFFSHKHDLKKHLRCHQLNMVDFKAESISLQGEEQYKGSKTEKLVSCDKCKKIFCSKNSYERHYRIHTGEKPYTCDMCGKQFRDAGGLRRHLNVVHDRIKSFGCDICGQFFASKATRDDHRRIHTGERPYACHCCGKTFKSKASLFTHSKTHSNTFPYPCSLCTKSFRRRQELLNHTITHTGEKPHVCEICGKSFGVKGEMLRHKITHSDDKPFVCDTCGLAFKQRRYLRNHAKIHSKCR